jgi:membrane protease YdiL (CAAX protease family)
MFGDEDDDDHDAPPSSRPWRPMSTMAALGWTAASVLLLFFALSVTDSVKPRETVDVVNDAACRVLSYSALLFVIVRLHAPTSPLRFVFAMRKTSVLGSIAAVLAAAPLSLALSFVEDWTLRQAPLPEDAERASHLPPLDTMGERAVCVVAFYLVVPIFEDLFFRGMIFTGLRRGRPEGPALTACAILAAASGALGDPRFFPVVLILSLFVTWVRARSGSLVPAIAAHIAYGIPEAALLLVRKEYDVGPRVALGSVVASAVLAGVAGALFARDARVESARALDA